MKGNRCCCLSRITSQIQLRSFKDFRFLYAHKSDLVHSCVKAYETKLLRFREVIADDYAIQQTGTELGVGQALLKLIKNRTQFQNKQNLPCPLEIEH